MAITFKRENIKSIDYDTKTITLKKSRSPKKVTGTRLSAVVGKNKFKSPFFIACDMTRLLTEVVDTKFTKAGEILEPKIRDLVRSRINGFAKELGKEGCELGVEEPIPKNDCYYDHFGNVPIFGGLVDGYITANGKHCAVLEIKTASKRDGWEDESGKITKAPTEYIMQNSLYTKLSHLDKMVFAVAFLEDSDYDNPENWNPTEDNFHILVIDEIDIDDDMKKAEDWYRKLADTFVLPPWTDADEDIVDAMTTKKLFVVKKNLEMYIKEYSEAENKEEYEPKIKSQLAESMESYDRKLIYEQNGLVFTVTRDNDIVTMKVEPATKADDTEP